MDTPFERLDRETREEWRQSPTTKAFLKTLAEHRQNTVDQVLDAVKSGHTDVLAVESWGADLRAIDFVIEIATKE